MLYLIVVMAACERMDIYDGDRLEQIKDKIVLYEKEGITVDTFETIEDYYKFSFSDGSSFGIKKERIGLATIDVRGFWCVNENVTDKSLDIPGKDIISLGDGSDIITGIVEGYTDWIFCFGDDCSIPLGKTLFAVDPDTKIRGINHRGFCVEAPENTLPAYRLSKLRGFNYVETDIRFTADNVPVLLHDATVDRTSDGYGEVKDISWAVISQLDFGKRKSEEYIGTRIPSLSEFLDLCRVIDLSPYLDIKAGNREQIKNLVDLVKESDMKERVTYISFSPAFLQYVLEIDESATVGLLTSSPMPTSAIQTILSLKTEINSVFIDSSDYSESVVSLCRSASIPLEIWTLDSKSVILSLSSYISGVTSNRIHAGRILLDNNS